MKYVSTPGTSSVLDINPVNTNRVIDPTIPLWVTEGVKKADRLTSEGLLAVALSGVFNWRQSQGILGAWEEIPLQGREVVICFDSDARLNRNVLNAMRRFGAWIKTRGAHVSYLIVPADVNGTPVKGADDFFVAGGTLDELMSVVTRTPPALPRSLDPADADMAEEVAVHFDGSFCWSLGHGWRAYDGRRWASATEPMAVEEVRTYLLGKREELFEKARQAPRGTDDERNLLAMADQVHRFLSATKIKAVTRLVMGIVEVPPSLFDTHPDLMNCPNGVADLKNDELISHDPDLRFTKITGVPYIQGAKHPDLDTILESIPAETRDYVQLRLGQAITGYIPPDDVVMIFLGGGENGKTTVFGAIKRHSANTSWQVRQSCSVRRAPGTRHNPDRPRQCTARGTRGAA